MLTPRDRYVLTRQWEGEGTRLTSTPLDRATWAAVVQEGPDDFTDAREFFAQVRRIDLDEPIDESVLDYVHAQHDRFFAGDFSLAPEYASMRSAIATDPYLAADIDRAAALASIARKSGKIRVICDPNGITIGKAAPLHAAWSAVGEYWTCEVLTADLRRALKYSDDSHIELRLTLCGNLQVGEMVCSKMVSSTRSDACAASLRTRDRSRSRHTISRSR